MSRRVVQAFRRLAILAVTFAAASVFILSGCRWFDADLRQHAISIKYIGPAPGPVPIDVGVIAGADKFWWPRVDAGQTRSVTLFVDKRARTTLVLLFSLGGIGRSWESDELAAGADYGIDLEIDRDGKIRSSLCRRPC